jgi:adenine C2-methylase RlmN of 23S rRNA A2503 and tRNA A37
MLLPENGDRVQSPKQCFQKKKQIGPWIMSKNSIIIEKFLLFKYLQTIRHKKCVLGTKYIFRFPLKFILETVFVPIKIQGVVSLSCEVLDFLTPPVSNVL